MIVYSGLVYSGHNSLFYTIECDCGADSVPKERETYATVIDFLRLGES